MFNSQILEIAIGLVFVFLIASLLASALRELIEGLLKTRAVQLERGLRLLLDDPSGRQTTSLLFAHPQIFSLFDGVYDPARLTRHWRFWKMTDTLRGGAKVSTHALRLPLGSKLPSYIPSRNFALALLDLLARDGSGEGAVRAGGGAASMEVLAAHAHALAPSRLRDALIVALNEAQGDFDRARTSLEAWFDANMDRVSGWYKRESQVVLLAIGMLAAVLFNIDTIAITRQLASNNTVRAQVVLQAEATLRSAEAKAGEHRQGDAPLDPQALADARKGLGDLLGWPKDGRLPPGWSLWQALGGWALTAVAISLGAPFWFDLLNKMMVVRATVKPFEKSPSEGSEDRAGPRPSAEHLAPGPGPGPAAAAGVAAAAPPAATGGPPTGSLRLAVDVDGLAGLALQIDGRATELPSTGLADLPLKLGVEHRLDLSATRTADGRAVAWSRVVRLTLHDDAQALDASLA